MLKNYRLARYLVVAMLSQLAFLSHAETTQEMLVEDPFETPAARRATPLAAGSDPFESASTETNQKGVKSSNAKGSQSTNSVSKEQCISDLQRALLAVKKAYTQNRKGATTLNDVSLGDYEIPASGCPPRSQNLGGQRSAFEDAKSLQLCGIQAIKCAIERVEDGGECKSEISSCQRQFLGR